MIRSPAGGIFRLRFRSLVADYAAMGWNPVKCNLFTRETLCTKLGVLMYNRQKIMVGVCINLTAVHGNDGTE